MDNEKELYEKIEKLRFELIVIAEKKGRDHPDTVQLSQKLDELLVQCQLIKCK